MKINYNKIIDNGTVYNLSTWAITQELFDWIRNNIPTGSIILELGSGEGTGILSKYYTMYSVEHDKQWLNKYKSNYIHAPLINDLWYDPQILVKNLPVKYDLLLVDGLPTSRRRLLFWDNRHIFNLSVPIILDDTVRPEEREVAMKFKYLGFRVEFIDAMRGRKQFAVVHNVPT